MEATAVAPGLDRTPTPPPSLAPQALPDRARDAAASRVEILVPVKNEEAGLASSVRRLRTYLDVSYPFTADVCIVDNGSTDDTWQVAQDLADELDGVRAVRLEKPGRGNALKTVWSCSDAEVLAYMDVDLSTDLDALLPLTAPLLSRHSDVAIGTRLAPGSRVVRGSYREFLSRGYNVLLRTALGVRFSDAQCGFKAVRADVAARLLPLVKDGSWFFDTELLVLAERAGLRIHEVPVDWVDDPDSRVDVKKTVLEDLKGVVRVRRDAAHGRLGLEALGEEFARRTLGPTRAPLPVRLARFAAVGVLSTVAYAVLFLLLRNVMGAQAANLASLLITAVGNTALNRRFTFGVSGRVGRTTHHLKGLVTFAVGWGLTAGTLALVHAGATVPSTTVEIVALTVANLAATVVKFGLFHAWVFRSAT
ncbi:glycosyltransferase [Solicola sp. PLA-1-18]|uniref:glycosyltransferase n=1 Tax=Solicola sp. PLA-1-18 TaxID=3380532 RepID=UPI003B7A6F5F